jgi:penicillin-binding protein 2
MKHFKLISILLVFAVLSACVTPSTTTPQGTQATAPGLPTPVVHVTSAPDPQSALQTFFSAWQAADYAGMYAMITPQSQQNISEEDFVKRYRDAMNEMALMELRYVVHSSTTNPDNAQINVGLTYVSNVIGEIQRDIIFPAVLENGGWKISWADGLILPELSGGNVLSMDYENAPRGDVFDKDGDVLVNETKAVAMYLVPGQILPDQEGTLLYEIANLTGQTQETVLSRYASAGADWYVAMGEASLEEINRRYGVISGLSGLYLVDYTSRFYYNGGIASQALGYVSAVPKEKLDEYMRAGYSRDALIGQSGLEAWGESYLSGTAGGTLYVSGPDGNILSYLGKNEVQPASALYMTIDKNLQIQAEQALGSFRGAIVVLERDTGRVLAMASTPDFDPNLFNPQNPNSLYGLGDVVNNEDRPLINRATQGEYPLGSVFKIITMAAALESGTYTAENTYECGYEFVELEGRTLYDWTWDHYQAELLAEGTGTTKPSGTLTLPDGLMRSCNPWFYHIGYDLYRQGRVTAVADMARGFGLGSPTNIDQIPEEAGNIVNPPEITEAVFQAIGQGQVTVTPLQVASFIAALGNGGTLYRPQLVEKLIAANGVETTIFKPEARGTLPLKPETLKIIQAAMRSVIANPRGTASHRFRNITIPVYAKTGTAESGIPGAPHSWFAGYTDVPDGSLPDIAIAVIVENKGEGSEYAAPIFRRVLESYYVGRPQALYWWEANIGIPKTPTPYGGIPTDTDN